MNKYRLTPEEIVAVTTFLDGDPNENPWVAGAPRVETIEVVPYDSRWSTLYDVEKNKIISVLGEHLLQIEHVGSTAVPNLAAKPVIDIDLIVANPADETSYVPQLTGLGYELTVREPSWYQHRMLRCEEPRINLHIFAPRCPEHLRHLLFRDWLCSHPADLADYAASKLEAKEGVNTAKDYNQNKHQTVQRIYKHIFNELTLIMDE